MHTAKLPTFLLLLCSFFFLGISSNTLVAQDIDCEENCEEELLWLKQRVKAAKIAFNNNPTEYNEYSYDYQVATYEAYLLLCWVRCEGDVLIDPNFCVRTYWNFHRDHVEKYVGTTYEASFLALLEWLKDSLGCKVP